MVSDAVTMLLGKATDGRKIRYISSYGDRHRVTAGVHDMYLSCRDPAAIIYRAVLIFGRVTVEISHPVVILTVMKQKG